jgi:hypothetical protein
MGGFYPFNPNLGQQIQGLTGKVVPVDMGFVAHYQSAPALGANAAVHANILLTAAPQTITTGITNPAVPRVLSVVADNAGVVGNVVINGTDMADAVIADTLALNGITVVVGTKAFKTVTSIQVPVETTAPDNVSVGTADVFGLPHKVYNALCLLVKLFNGATDAGTLTVNATDLCKNLYDPAGTPDGAKLLDLFYLV